MARAAVDHYKAELIRGNLLATFTFSTKPKGFAFHIAYCGPVVNLVHFHAQLLYKPIVFCFPFCRRRTDS